MRVASRINSATQSPPDNRTRSSRKIDEPDREENGVRIGLRHMQPAEFVIGMLSALRELSDMGMSPETCAMHIEDRLHELYLRSLLLAEFANDDASEKITFKHVTQRMGIPASDIPLLLSIATTHHPGILARFNPADLAY